MNLENLVEEVRNYLYDEDNNYVQVEIGEEEINFYLDLPSTSNYNYFVNLIENFLLVSTYDIEDFSIDGDYEGTITLYCEA